MVVDVAALAAQVAATLAPSVPYLLGKVADQAGHEIGRETLQQAQALWARLRPAVESRPSAHEAVNDVAEHPADQDAQAALRLQIRKVLAEDLGLSQELARVLAETAPRGDTSVRVTASGERSVAIGGDNPGTISTGDSGRASR
jgi:hypothetical protein